MYKITSVICRTRSASCKYSPNVIQRLSRSFNTLSDKNADRDNWEWKADAKAVWKPATRNWRDFCAKWYGATESQSVLLVDPKSPSLSLEPLRSNFDPSISSDSSSIVLRKSYVTMFDKVWAQAIVSQGRRGVIITGQPGIGKTLFQYYLLVRLLQRKQVVLFSPDGKTLLLFYHNEVYTVRMEALTTQGIAIDESLPNPIPSSNTFIWSLFDICEPKEPESFLVTPPCFPVQTVSPNPIRYKIWHKKWRPLIIGLPLWTRDELAQGLQYQRQYHSLLDALHKVYRRSSPNLSDPLQGFPGARALLEERYGGEDIEQPSPEDALDYLLDAAIYRFGYSARDTFDAVFNYSEMTLHYENAFDITFTESLAALSAISQSRTTGHCVSHRILAMSPVDQGPHVSVRWDMEFRSRWVTTRVTQALSEAEDTITRQLIHIFRKIPEVQGSIGRLIEPIVHRYIANATGAGDFWPLISMDTNGADPPCFSLDQNSPVLDNPRFIKVKRQAIVLQSLAELSASLENYGYYIPSGPTFPLLDAFSIELDYEKNTAVLWIFQVTISKMHKGSEKGYQKIREIIAVLKDELGKDQLIRKTKAATVEVRYVLVVPKDESKSEKLQWQFPIGWGEKRKRNNHCGEVFCLEVPLW